MVTQIGVSDVLKLSTLLVLTPPPPFAGAELRVAFGLLSSFRRPGIIPPVDPRSPDFGRVFFRLVRFSKRRKTIKKLFVLALVLATALAGAVPALAQQQGAAEKYVSGDTSNAPPGAPEAVVGAVTEISDSLVLVEEDFSSDAGAKGYFTVTEETAISKEQGEVRVTALFEELEVGQRVEAAYAGPIAESDPTQGDAASIVILENSDCPFPGGCKDPGPPPDEVKATGVIEPLADNADAEHGMTDEATGISYALASSAVNLDAYADSGQRVAVYGAPWQTLVATGYPVLEVSRIEVLDGTEQHLPGDVATFTYELAVECEPPANAEFFGFVATESAVTTPLTDPDGDGVYAGNLKTPKFAPGGSQNEPITVSPVRMVQGPPTGTGPLGPEYRVIEDFGPVTAEDTILSASVSFCGGEEPPPEEEVSVTGTLEELEADPVVVDGIEICGRSTHLVTDEATKQHYDLTSDAVDLEGYVGKRVAVTGTPLASPAIEGAERCPDLDVTRVELLDDGDGGPGPAPMVSGGANDDKGSSVPRGGGCDGGDFGGIKSLPATGGALLVAALTGLALIAGGILARRKFAR